MNLGTDEGNVAALREELERCRRELDACRRRAEAAEALFANVADPVIVARPDGRIVEVNPAACELLGYSKEELLRSHPWDFVTSASPAEILAAMQEVQPGRPVTLQRTYRSKSGEHKIMDLRLARCGASGTDLIIVSCRDVTERHQLLARLRRSEKNLAEGQRLTKTGSWVLDFKSGATDWSVETCRIFGFPDPPPSPHYREFRARVREEDRAGVDHGLRESFETGEPRPLRYVFILPNGERKNIETISERVSDETGELRLMGTVMDVTDRVRAEEALRQSEAHLRRVIDTIPGLVWSARPDGYVEYHNRRWIDYTGLTAEAARGWGWRAAIHPDDLAGLEKRWQALLASGQAGEAEARFRRFDGQYRWFLFRGVPLHDSAGKLIEWYGANTDIEDLKQTAGALKNSEQCARAQTDTLSRILDALARESSTDRVVEHVLRTVTAQLGGVSSSVWLKDKASDLMRFEFSLEEDQFRTKAHAALAAVSPSLRIQDVWPWPEVFRTGKPSVLPDIRQAPDFPWRDHVLAQGVISILVVPMLIAGKVEGVIGVRFTQARPFSAEELQLAQALAHQAMLAIQLRGFALLDREAAVAAERNRMARDMHDTLAQGFTGVITQLEAAKGAAAKENPAAVMVHIERASELARTNLGDARRSVHALRPRSLQDGSLATALDGLLKAMTAGTALQAEFVVQGEDRIISPEWEEGLLRIAQESLTNTMKHSQARRFDARLTFSPEQVHLQLLDDGQGFAPGAEHDGFGLLGMKERAEQMSARFVIRSAPGQGTEIAITLDRRGTS